ncbi:multicopper oxidase domain-containing protein [Vibrio ouci]|uniref:Plastocyanin-like domain-containing protein n=1 Tax=Vibrio ouci TaxID=2499078 RepID=A0A4Y8WH89_9VIBR|nr:multicopper oxidase domain-containing protein [Vibrio ouci]TFH92016.1 hypothetical protein ELS82_08680 [Vibrio ouci]
MFRFPSGPLEHWVIQQGNKNMLHPFHIHGCRFQIFAIDGQPPAPNLMRWKDTVPVFPKGQTELLVKFDQPVNREFPYMAHCHILEHEDTGMMKQLTVS